MPKILCLIALVISAIILLIFLANLLIGVPFGNAGGILINIGMIVGSLVIGTFSVLTYLEIR
jgi:hypothetical protein